MGPGLLKHAAGQAAHAGTTSASQQLASWHPQTRGKERRTAATPA